MVSETVEVKGHIIDSLVLPKILDTILAVPSARFDIEDVRIGRKKSDTSYARLTISAPSRSVLDKLLLKIEQMGAQPTQIREVKLARAPKDGVFPERFYSTTNLPTSVYFRKAWRPVLHIEMDCAIRVEKATGRASTVPMSDAKKGDLIVAGQSGIRVTPLERERNREVFQFMASSVSSEKPKVRLIHALAEEMHQIKAGGGKILFVAGPAVVHTGAIPYFVDLVERGYVDVLFGGNGLATHDAESAILGTSLGVDLKSGKSTQSSHDHHMRIINRMRRLGGLRQAVQKGVLKSGLMYSCMQRGVRVVLVGSVRDDGPLPDVITDMLEAQNEMRRALAGVELAVMIASTLHSIATGNMLPATVRTVCVDINPAVVTKLSDRGTFQNVGLVTDSESFLRELARQIRNFPSFGRRPASKR
ncbi:MAG: TIGR00300 family protein [Candidatus Omnitrophica bacterium]|nr:TIGR00300 family protein [Candidatus Omnitrophota bacterium]